MSRPAFGLFLLAAVLTGCGRGDPAPRTQPGTLDVLLPADAIDPQIPVQFERVTDVAVAIHPYADADEQIARLRRQSGDAPGDLLVAPVRHARELIELGLVQPLDLADVPQVRHLDERFRRLPGDPDGQYALPYQWGTVGILYRRDRIERIEPTWALFFDSARRPGPFVLLDDSRQMLAAALCHLGHSVNTTDPAAVRAAAEAVREAKEDARCLGLEAASGAIDRVIAGEAVMTIASSRDALRAMAEHEGLAYVVPEEGAVLWVDAMFMLADAEDPDLALRFMDYLLGPQIGAQLAEWNQAGTPNLAAQPYIPPEQRANPAIYPPGEAMDRLEPLEPLGEAGRAYDEAWAAMNGR